MPGSGLALTVGLAIEAVRESAPIVHCVPPRASTSFVADVLHGGGARAVVTGTSRDALDAAVTADAVLLDLGTLVSDWSDAVPPTIAEVRGAGVPWVLDATPLGRTPLRADLVRGLLVCRPAVVRASSIEMEGVRFDACEGALVLGGSAARIELGERAIPVPTGPALLAQMPGVRAAVSALIAACAAVTGRLEAAVAGAAWLAFAAERAKEHSRGPASFRVALIDALWTVRGDEIAEYLNL